MNAIETLQAFAITTLDRGRLVNGVWEYERDYRQALAAVEALLEAAKAITLDPEFPGRGPLTITRGQKEALAAAVRRVESGQ